VIVGTVYKEMRLKPNILDEHHAREKYEAPPPPRSKYHSVSATVS
jgi:DNA polymerase delta subunit 2